MRNHRGKIKATGYEGDRDWVFGDKLTIDEKVYILPEYCNDLEHEDEDWWSIRGLIEVIPETVG